MDEIEDRDRLVSAGAPAARLDPSTTYCGYAGCEQLRRIVKVDKSHQIPVMERVELSAAGGYWEETDRVAYERSVRLECEHTKGVIGT